MTTCGVLFDMDGVLVDSASLHVRAYERVFRDVGLHFPDVARDAVFAGKARSEVLDLALAKADLKKRLSDAKLAALRTVLRDTADCSMPGATATVRALARAGVPMAVVTNSRSPEIWIEKIGIADHIRVLISGDDVSSPKPSAEGYLLGAKRLGLHPSNCLAVEDTRDGWMAAKSAGMSGPHRSGKIRLGAGANRSHAPTRCGANPAFAGERSGKLTETAGRRGPCIFCWVRAHRASCLALRVQLLRAGARARGRRHTGLRR
jgi:beta-phosphoglucomutase